VVIIKKGGRKLQQMAMFESQAAEDVLEMHMGNASLLRSWMAAFHSPRYLLSRGMHLVSAVAGKTKAPRQVDLWERVALVNMYDATGETPLHAALRGAVPGETSERVRLLAWLLDAGATPALPTAAKGMPVDPLELLLERAAASQSDESDAMFCELLQLLLSRAHSSLAPAELSARVDVLKPAYSPKLLDCAPKTQALLMRSPLPAPSIDSMFAPMPTPSEANEGRSLVLLSLARVDLAGSGFEDVPHPKMGLTVSMVHEPATGGAAVKAVVTGAGGGLAERSAKFEQMNPEGRARSSTGAGGVARKRLATLVAEQRSGAPLQSASMDHSSTLWWHSTWSAPYLPGEEGALLLVSLVQTGSGVDEIVGWAAQPCDELGEIHAQLYPAPLPSSLSEAKYPRSEPLEAWLHGELSLALTGSHAAYLQRHPDAVRQESPSPPPQDSKGGVFRRGSIIFSPFLSPRRRSTHVGPPSPVRPNKATDKLSTSSPSPKSANTALNRAIAVLEDLPEPPKTLAALLAVELGLEEILPRDRLITIVSAAAEAAKGAQPLLALRGYSFAFTQSGHAAMLLSIGNMHLKLHNLDAATEVYQYLDSGGIALTADQRTVLVDKIGELQEQRRISQAGPQGLSSPRPEYMKRASVRHQIMDTNHINELEGKETLRDVEDVLRSPKSRAQSVAHNAEI